VDEASLSPGREIRPGKRFVWERQYIYAKIGSRIGSTEGRARDFASVEKRLGAYRTLTTSRKGGTGDNQNTIYLIGGETPDN